jgi:hypothetical protein
MAKGFQKGKSGNPSGRPKVVEEFRQRARKAVDEKVLDAWIAEVDAQGEHWVECSKMLAAYGYGKPTEHLKVDDAGTHVLRDVSDDMLIAFVMGKAKPE